MKKIFKLPSLALLILSLIIFSGCSSNSKSIFLGEKAPFTRFILMDGTIKTTENYKGKYLLLIFWATHCAKSQSVMDDLGLWLRDNNALRDNKGVKIQAISVNVDKANKEEKVREIISKEKLSYMQHAYSGNDIYDEAYMRYDVGELPTLVLIDPSGKVVGSGDSMDVIEDAFRAR